MNEWAQAVITKASDIPQKEAIQHVLIVRADAGERGSYPARPTPPSKATKRLFGLDQALPLAAFAGDTETAECVTYCGTESPNPGQEECCATGNLVPSATHHRKERRQESPESRDSCHNIQTLFGAKSKGKIYFLNMMDREMQILVRLVSSVQVF